MKNIFIFFSYCYWMFKWSYLFFWIAKILRVNTIIRDSESNIAKLKLIGGKYFFNY